MRKKEIKGVQAIGDTKSYVPDESLVSFIQEWLQIHKKREKLTKKGEELSADEKKRIRELDRMKVYHLDNTIFPAMANLVYFFEAIGSSKILSEGFEDEVIELVSPGNVKSAARMSADGMRMSSMQFNRNNLARLIIAILNTPRSKKPTPLSKFRISLMYQLQNIVGDEMDAMILQEYSYSQIWKSALEDYGRMKGWLALLARSTEDYKDEPTRNLGFLPIWLSNKATISEMEF
jgi:hypothetical protein